MTAPLSLTKHHALGNDFLVTFDSVCGDAAALARRICDRRRGIGADGLLMGTDDPDRIDGVTMRLINADGSPAEMSGNGIRCFAQALAMRRGSMADQRIITDAGVRLVTLAAAGPNRIEATVAMGPVRDLDETPGWAEIGADPMRPVAHLSLGNPHCVVGVEDVASVDLAALGGRRPQVNVEIVEPGPAPDAITMRVHERGAGITEACGTGACASAFAARRWGLVPATASEIVVHMDGGDARVRFTDQGEAILTGPADYVGSVRWEMTQGE